MKSKKPLFKQIPKIFLFEYKLMLLISIITLPALSKVTAQENINTSGGNTSGSGGSLSYSIGQIAFQTQTETIGSVAEGVQQPFEILIVTGLEETYGVNLTVSAYPNPTTDYLTLSINEFEISNLLCELYDISGKLLQNKIIIESNTEIDMSRYLPSTYIVKIIRGNQLCKEFKVVKH